MPFPAFLELISNSAKLNQKYIEIQAQYITYASDYYKHRDRERHRPCNRRLDRSDCFDGPNCEWSSGMFGMWGNCRPKDDVEFTKVYEHILLLLMAYHFVFLIFYDQV